MVVLLCMYVCLSRGGPAAAVSRFCPAAAVSRFCPAAAVSRFSLVWSCCSRVTFSRGGGGGGGQLFQTDKHTMVCRHNADRQPGMLDDGRALRLLYLKENAGGACCY